MLVFIRGSALRWHPAVVLGAYRRRGVMLQQELKDKEMITQQEVHKQLDVLANEVLQPAGLYYELYSRLFSQRVQRWIETAPETEAQLIRRIAENDPDFSADIDSEIEGMHYMFADKQPLINPAWDMDY
ncbi:MAG: hypothetical protein JWM78_1514 [Verrucomicrobiaceae bacterium]|nr:hypothetical protein [Verrucomicrobiaceae bacterium]